MNGQCGGTSRAGTWRWHSLYKRYHRSTGRSCVTPRPIRPASIPCAWIHHGPCTIHSNRKGGRGRLTPADTPGPPVTPPHPPPDAHTPTRLNAPPVGPITTPNTTTAPRNTSRLTRHKGAPYPLAVAPPPQPRHTPVPSNYSSVSVAFVHTGRDGDEILMRVETRGNKRKWSLPTRMKDAEDGGACLRAAAHALWLATSGRITTATCSAIETGEILGPVHQLNGSPTLLVAYRAEPLELHDLQNVTCVQGHATSDPTFTLGWLPIQCAADTNWCQQHLHYHSQVKLEAILPLITHAGGASDQAPTDETSLTPTGPQTSANMLAAAGLHSTPTPPDGACFYWSMLLATHTHRSRLRLDPMLPTPHTTFRDTPNPLEMTNERALQLCTAMRRLRELTTDWLLDPAHRGLFVNGVWSAPTINYNPNDR